MLEVEDELLMETELDDDPGTVCEVPEETDPVTEAEVEDELELERELVAEAEVEGAAKELERIDEVDEVDDADEEVVEVCEEVDDVAARSLAPCTAVLVELFPMEPFM